MKRALVLAGGGVAGIAWELGVLRGIQDADPDLEASLAAADVIVGTSAGSAVAGQITSGTPLEDLYAVQLAPGSSEIEVDFDMDDLIARFASVADGATMAEEIRWRIGALALATPTVEESARRAAIAARLPVHAWPDRVVLLAAIEAETGELTVFTRESRVSLVDAVAASCAVPMVYPPISIGGHRYIDGGSRSIANADVATGCSTVVVIGPFVLSLRRRQSVERQVASLGSGIRSIVIKADEHARKAMGTQALDPTHRVASARAGREQAKGIAGAVSEVWAAVRA